MSTEMPALPVTKSDPSDADRLRVHRREFQRTQLEHIRRLRLGLHLPHGPAKLTDGRGMSDDIAYISRDLLEREIGQHILSQGDTDPELGRVWNDVSPGARLIDRAAVGKCPFPNTLPRDDFLDATGLHQQVARVFGDEVHLVIESGDQITLRRGLKAIVP